MNISLFHIKLNFLFHSIFTSNKYETLFLSNSIFKKSFENLLFFEQIQKIHIKKNNFEYFLQSPLRIINSNILYIFESRIIYNEIIIEILNTNFQNCFSIDQIGGGFYCFNLESILTLSNCNFYNCTSLTSGKTSRRTTISGGAFVFNGNSLFISNCCFLNCNGFLSSFVFYSYSLSETHFNNSHIYNCGKVMGQYGVFFIDNSTQIINNYNSSYNYCDINYVCGHPGTDATNLFIQFCNFQSSSKANNIFGFGYNKIINQTLKYCNFINNRPLNSLLILFNINLIIEFNYFINNTGLLWYKENGWIYIKSCYSDDLLIGNYSIITNYFYNITNITYYPLLKNKLCINFRNPITQSKKLFFNNFIFFLFFF